MNQREQRLTTAVSNAVNAPTGARPETVTAVKEVSAETTLGDAYTYLQRAVGIIAITLPFVIGIIDRWIRHKHHGSISAYYYERTGNYFVGSLFALAVFFFSYNYRPLPGHQLDRVFSKIASLMAAGVAMMPTSSEGSKAHGGSQVIAACHLVCAGILFTVLAIFSLYLFTQSSGPSSTTSFWNRLLRIFRTDPLDLPLLTDRKKLRNKIYRVCGWLIVASVLMIPLCYAFSWDLVFWFESIAVVSFGFSWLVKGETIFADN